MSTITDNAIFAETDSFSIVKIDETIARSRKIVQDSLAITKNSKLKSGYESQSSSPRSINNSIFEPAKFSPSFKKLISDNHSLLKELESQEAARYKEINRLEEILSNLQRPSSLEKEELLKSKNSEILELQAKISSNPVHKENQEIRGKIKEYEGVEIEGKILSEILFERKSKEELEKKYNELYDTYKENSKKVEKQVKKIREDIRSRQAENKKTINFLCSKLEEKILDNQLIVDQFRLDRRKLSMDSKENRRNSMESEILECGKKIQELQAELKKYKAKYKSLKKTVQKIPRRCSSIETRSKKDQKPKKAVKKKTVLKSIERTFIKKKQYTPVMTT